MRNTYQSVEYFIIPTGFVNLYYFFHEDFVYFAINQLTINKLVDSIQKPETVSEKQKRALDYIDTKHNTLFLVDPTQLAMLRESVVGMMFENGRRSGRAIRGMHGYLADIDLVVRTLAYDETSIEDYFHWIPKDFLGVAIDINTAGVTLTGAKEIKLKNLKPQSPWGSGYPYGIRPTDKEKESHVAFADLIPESFREDFREGLKKVNSFAIGTTFTEHGLDTKLTVNNPRATVPDSRFDAYDRQSILPTRVGQLLDSKSRLIQYLLFGLIGFIVLVVVLGVLRKRAN